MVARARSWCLVLAGAAAQEAGYIVRASIHLEATHARHVACRQPGVGTKLSALPPAANASPFWMICRRVTFDQTMI